MQLHVIPGIDLFRLKDFQQQFERNKSTELFSDHLRQI